MNAELARSRPRWARWRDLPARIVPGVVFVPAGLGKFVNHSAYIERFDRWGIPAPGAAAYLAGTVEVLAGLLVLLGVAPRAAALSLCGVMAVALATAGRIDGGRDVWLPILMIAVAASVVIRGSRRGDGPGDGIGPIAGRGIRPRRRGA